MALLPARSFETVMGSIGELSLMGARVVLATIYLGLIGVLAFIAYNFFYEIFHKFPGLGETELMLQTLTLIDLALLAGLVVMVMASGYDNFVADLDTEGDSINWMSRIDSDSIKLKIAASIVAISSIKLLQVYMNVGTTLESNLFWYAVIHSVFVLSAIGLALFNKLKH